MVRSMLRTHSRSRLAPLSQPRLAPPRSCDKKLLQLGWQEKTNWEDGLRKTVDWYLKNATRDYWCAAAVRHSTADSPDATSGYSAAGCLCITVAVTGKVVLWLPVECGGRQGHPPPTRLSCCG